MKNGSAEATESVNLGMKCSGVREIIVIIHFSYYRYFEIAEIILCET